MLREFVIISYILVGNGRWDDLREFYALSREFLASTTRLSPEDQMRLDKIFQEATGIVTKDDDALKN